MKAFDQHGRRSLGLLRVSVQASVRVSMCERVGVCMDIMVCVGVCEHVWTREDLSVCVRAMLGRGREHRPRSQPIVFEHFTSQSRFAHLEDVETCFGDQITSCMSTTGAMATEHTW